MNRPTVSEQQTRNIYSRPMINRNVYAIDLNVCVCVPRQSRQFLISRKTVVKIISPGEASSCAKTINIRGLRTFITRTSVRER